MKQSFRLIQWTFCVVVLVLFMGCNEERIFTFPDQIKINEAVYSNAVILPEFQYKVYSPVAGIIEEVYIEEGDTVRAGDILFKIKDDQVKISSQAAAIDVALAQASLESQSDILDELTREIDIAKTKLEFDSIQFKRQEKLWEKQIGTKVELDSKELNYQTSERQLNALQSKYGRLERELTLALDKSKKNLEKARVNSEDFVIRAQVDGIIYGMFKEKGESTTSTLALAEIGSTENFIIELEVDEFDISKIKIGQKIALQMDAFQDKVFQGTLRVIYPKLNQSTKSFTVEGSFDDPPSPLYSGLSGEANIIIGQKDSALVIPTPYLKLGNKVETDSGETEVVIGVQNMNYTEITEGLNTETKIYLPSDED